MRGVSLLLHLRSQLRRHHQEHSPRLSGARALRRPCSRTSRQPLPKRGVWLARRGLLSPPRREDPGCFVLPRFRPNHLPQKRLLREEVLIQKLNKLGENHPSHPDVLLLRKRTPRRRGVRSNPLPRMSALSCKKQFGGKWPKKLPGKLAFRNQGARWLPMSAVPGS